MRIDAAANFKKILAKAKEESMVRAYFRGGNSVEGSIKNIGFNSTRVVLENKKAAGSIISEIHFDLYDVVALEIW